MTKFSLRSLRSCNFLIVELPRDVNYLVARQKSVVVKVEGEPVPPQPRRLRDAVVRNLQSG